MKTIILTILGAIGLGALFILPVWLIDHQKPKSFEERQEIVKEIKLCTDNGLDTYQGSDSSWYCSPKKP